MATATLAHPGEARAWLLALRPRTLSASVAPVLVGLGLAVGDGVFRPEVAAATLLGALLLQLGVNLANDYYDHRSGVDREDRKGPPRVTATLIPEQRVRAAMGLVLAAAALVGAVLVWQGGMPILAIGVAGLACALAYAGGPWPLGHHGLGEVTVFAFFGPIAVAGTHYLQAGAFSGAAAVAGVGPGALAAAILLVNNIRDVPTDARAGKRTVAVRVGVRRAWGLFGAMLGLAALVPLLMVGFFAAAPGTLAAVAIVPLGLSVVRDGLPADGAALNPLLGRTALALGLYGALLAGGLAL